jgi:hypothetical protein
MAQTFQGDVSFELHNKTVPHRFEVTVTDENKIILWMEDRQSKKQWCVVARHVLSGDVATDLFVLGKRLRSTPTTLSPKTMRFPRPRYTTMQRYV